MALVLMCFCLAAFIFFQQQDSAYFRSAFSNELLERQSNLRNIVDLYARPLKVFSADYSFWDDLVAFVHKPDPAWAEENINVSLDTFGADVVWIFDARQTLVYSTESVSDEYLRDVFNVIDQAAARIQRETFISFFLSSPRGPIQVYGASIHPSADAARKTPAAGYVFIGRLWDEAVLKEMGALSMSALSISSLALSNDPRSFREQNGLVFSLPLEDVSGKADTFLVVQMSAPELALHERASRKRIVLLLSAFLFLFVAIASSFFYLVNRPLNEISSLVSSPGIPAISGLCGRHDEFGGIAQVILESKRQKLELAREKELTQKYLDIARVMLVVVGSNGKVLMVNKEACRILGFVNEEE